MGLAATIKRWWNGLFSKKTIEDAFGIQISVTPLMLQKQKLFRQIVRGAAPWNGENTPSMMLAGSIGAEVARKVTVGLESEIFGGEAQVIGENGEIRKKRAINPRSEYLNEQYAKVREGLRNAVITACNDGEIIFKPYMIEGGLETTVSTGECYWPVTYNAKDELIDVIFGAELKRDRWAYKLLERHIFDESALTHEIAYRAFKNERTAQEITPESLGRPIPLSEVPEWANLRDITIRGVERPLFAHFRLPTGDAIEHPQRQGLPVWSKAVEMLRKADLQEMRTDWEFEGGELAIDASEDLFRRDGGKKGEAVKPLALPEGKSRLFRTLNVSEEHFQMKEFAPAFRIDGLSMRMNDILRRIEFLSGLSYGILSDANVQEKTATEVLASKDRFFTTVSDIQQALQKALEHLIYSYDVLADLQGVPPGAYEVSFTWDDSIASDRVREFEERIKAQNAGWLSNVENRAWWLGVNVDSEEAQNVPETLESEF